MGSLVQNPADITVYTEIVGGISGTIAVLTAAPQILKARQGIRTHGKVIGVSLSTWLVTYASYAAWFGISFTFPSPSQIVTNLVAASLVFVLLILLIPRKYPVGVELGAVVGLGVVSAAITFLAPAPVAYAYLSVFVVSRVPQLKASWDTYRAGTSSDVSIPTWVLSNAAATGWIVYGVMAGVYANIVFSAITIVMNTAIIVLEMRANRRATHIPA